MRIRSVRLFALLILALAPAAVVAEELVDTQFGFRLSVPSGFQRDDSLVKGHLIYAFRRAGVAGGQDTFLIISRLEGTIGREKISSKQAAAIKPGMSVLPEKWQGFDIEVFRIADSVDGRNTLRLHAQIPLAREAIQVGVVGDQSAEPELRFLLHDVLDHLEGHSNWLIASERSDRVLYLVAGGAVAILVFALGRLRMSRERGTPNLIGNRTLLAGGVAVCTICGAPLPKVGVTRCSVCGAPQKSPKSAERLVGRGMLLGMACGTVLGGMWGYDYIAKEWAGALGGALVMSIPGMLLGLVAGLVRVAIRRFSGRSDSTSSSSWAFNPASMQRTGSDRPPRS